MGNYSQVNWQGGARGLEADMQRIISDISGSGVFSETINSIVVLTPAAYEQLSEPNPTTLYVEIEETP